MADTARTVIERFVEVRAGERIVCEDLRLHVSEKLGYDVAGPAVSRILGNLGWRRETEPVGKTVRVVFMRPAQ